ncbi:MAG: hypothetical protein Q8N18_03245 [Opitutaceae bacterium]|nr:hypothetical protein [Opitutaceae bacterium]
MKTHVIWSAVAIVALFVGTRFAKTEVRNIEKPVEVVRTKEVVVEKPVEVVREVVKVVPKEVERIVERRIEVPAEIPEIYKKALSFREAVLNAKTASAKEALTGVTSVSVEIHLTDDIKNLISESEIRTKFEINLRRSGVPISEKSDYTLVYYQDGFTRGNPTLTYSFSTSLTEFALLARDGGPKFHRNVAVWRSGNFGTVGVSKAREALLAAAESAAEEFANDWLAMNPKK